MPSKSRGHWSSPRKFHRDGERQRPGWDVGCGQKSQSYGELQTGPAAALLEQGLTAPGADMGS